MLSDSIGYAVADVGSAATPMFKLDSFNLSMNGSVYSVAFPSFKRELVTLRNYLSYILNNKNIKIRDASLECMHQVYDHLPKIERKSDDAPLVKPLNPGSLYRRVLDQAVFLKEQYNKHSTEFNITDVDASLDVDVLDAIDKATLTMQQACLILSGDYEHVLYPKAVNKHFVSFFVPFITKVISHRCFESMVEPDSIAESVNSAAISVSDVQFIKYMIARYTAVCRAYLHEFVNCDDVGLTSENLAALVISVTPPSDYWVDKSLGDLICESLSACYAAVTAYDKAMLPNIGSVSCPIDPRRNDANITKNFDVLETYFKDRQDRLPISIYSSMFLFDSVSPSMYMRSYNHARYDYGIHALMLHSLAHRKIQASAAIKEDIMLIDGKDGSLPPSHLVAIKDTAYNEFLVMLARVVDLSSNHLKVDGRAIGVCPKSIHYMDSPFPKYVYFYRVGMLDTVYVPFFVGVRSCDCITYILIPSTERAAASIRKIYNLPERDMLAVSNNGLHKLTDYHLANYGYQLIRGESSLVYTGVHDFRSYLLGTEERDASDCSLNDLFHAFTFFRLQEKSLD